MIHLPIILGAAIVAMMIGSMVLSILSPPSKGEEGDAALLRKRMIEELDGTLWLLADGRIAKFKDVDEDGKYFKLETQGRIEVRVLAHTLKRVDDIPVREIA